MSNGFFQIAGVQTGTASAGTQSLGPFNQAFGPITDTLTLTVNTTATIAVPATSFGVVVTPPLGGTTPTLQWSTVSLANASAGNFLSPGGPSYWNWDQAHIPTNLYLNSGGSVVVVVQFV